MSSPRWSWRYEPASPALSSPTFPSQADAETWMGESWRELAASGVVSVFLLQDDREVYGPMPLHAGSSSG